ncbi:smad/FHA domain protein [Senna tora]|uniref:Smad/FHA domain protein n=1 Tax=Senna tora TaxID=362788 RepID=A0A834WR33_9FABA|nr:smad/FHA domain protein [Senna tora]
MESIVHSLALARAPKSHASLSPAPLLSHSNASSSLLSFSSATHCSIPKGFLARLGPAGVRPKLAKEKGSLRPICASEAESPVSTTDAERWLLVPVGDGDSRHIGFKVEMPGAYEIASSDVTVGRVPEKADLVIPVATVSGVHARIQKKEGNLLVTDLDSTNGTFIDDKKLRPGVVSTVSPGSCITFGDIHLAMFRVSKVANIESASKGEEAQVQLDNAESN